MIFGDLKKKHWVDFYHYRWFQRQQHKQMLLRMRAFVALT